MKSLESRIVPVGDISRDQIVQMLALMQSHYENVTAEQFHADLAGKTWAILLFEKGALRGFSTQVVFNHVCDTRQVRILFSGDTIVDRSCWGSWALPVAWVRLALSLAADQPEQSLYWLLTSKGYKTYRFLPVFFRQYYPSHLWETPAFEHFLLTEAAKARFGERFDVARGVLRSEPGSQRLRPGIADINEARRNDPHIAFFETRNPGHAHGDELVCLARCDESNLHPFILRQLTP